MNADIELVQKDIKNCLADLFRSAENELVIASPYVGSFGVNSLRESLQKRFCRSGGLYFLTDLSPRNVCQASTDPFALRALTESISQSKIIHLPKLHAKVYVADKAMAIITSGNLTKGGLVGNYEYGVKITNPTVVERIRDDIWEYGELGAPIDASQLSGYCAAADEIRGLYSKAQKSVSDNIMRRFEKKVKVIEDNLLRYKVGDSEGVAIHPLFEKTVLYLLKKHGPLRTTEDLYPLISAIHPDLCSDSADRVIRERNFGRKWQQAVRTAQQKLKKKGLVAQDIPGRGEPWRYTGK